MQLTWPVIAKYGLEARTAEDVLLDTVFYGTFW